MFENLRTFLGRRQALRELRTLDKPLGYSGAHFEDEVSRAYGTLRSGDAEKALEIWREVRREFPKLAMVSKSALRFLLDIGAFDEIEDMMRRGMERYPDHAEHFATGYAQAAYRRGDAPAALERCDYLRRNFPNVVEGYTIAAVCLNDLQRSQEAEAMIAQGLRRFPSDYEMCIEYARFAMRRQDLPEALRRWEVTKEQTGDHGIDLNIAECLRLMGKYADAEAVVLAINQRNPGDYGAAIEAARIADARGDIERACGLWERVRQRNGADTVGYVAGAAALRRAGQAAGADELLRAGVARLHGNLEIAVEYARSAQWNGDRKAAAERWAAVREQFPDFAGAPQHEATALAAMDKAMQPVVAAPQESEASAPMDNAGADAFATPRAMWLEGDRDGACNAWRTVEASADAWWAQAGALTGAGELDAAEAMLAVAVDKGIESAPILFEHAVLAERRGDHRTAAARYTLAARHFPEHADSWVLALRTLRNTGQYEAAAALSADALLATPDNVAVLVEAAGVAEAQRDLAAVRELCGKVRALMPEAADAWIMEARAMRNAGDLDGAAAVLAAADGVSHPHPTLLTEAAIVAQARGDMAGLERIAVRLRQDHPSSPEGYEITLRSRIAAGELAAAEALFADLPPAALADPGLTRTGCDLATRMGDQELALRRWTDAVARFPDSGEFRGMLVLALGNAGRSGEAEDYAEAHMDRFPDEPRLAMEFARGAEIRGDRETSLKRWEFVRTQFPHMPDGYIYCAGLLLSLGKYDEAEAVTAAGQERFPDEAWIAKQHAQCATARHDWPEALRRWDAGLRRFPSMEREMRDGLGDVRMRIELAQLEQRDFSLRIEDIDRVADATRSIVKIAGIETMPDREFFLAFESLGDNCAFGGLQRIFGAEPLGLLRWSNVGPEALQQMLNTRFDGVGESETSFVVLSRETGDYDGGDRRYFRMHTFVRGVDVPEETMFQQVRRRLSYLKDKLVRDLDGGEKIFVYTRSEGELSDEAIAGLHGAIRRYGPAPLLCIRRTMDASLDGHVAMVADGLMVGTIYNLEAAPASVYKHTVAFLSICRAAHERLRAEPPQ